MPALEIYAMCVLQQTSHFVSKNSEHSV